MTTTTARTARRGALLALAAAAPLVGVAAPAGADFVPGGSGAPPEPSTNGDTEAQVNGDPGTSGTRRSALSALEACGAWSCVYVGSDYQGRRGRFREPNATWGAFANADCPSGTWKDCASSSVNGRTVNFWVSTAVSGSSGYVGYVPAGGTVPLLPSPFDNNIESNLS